MCPTNPITPQILPTKTAGEHCQSDDSVKVSVKLRCYNSDEASGDDYSQAQINSFVVGPDETWSGWIYSDDDNYAEADFSVTNRTNQS